jgi:hypothetical protein
MPRSSVKSVTPSVTPEERWTTVQVASFLMISYQTARNNMLAGDYGLSEYDAKTRTLSVLASRVQAAKSKRGRKKKRRA